MKPEEIREIVGGVIPPKDTKDVSATDAEKKAISQMCPFYGPIVKGRVPGVEGSDLFLDGLTETFCRIWRTLAKAGHQSLVKDLQLKDLQSADERLTTSGTNMLEAEYPMIDMHVPERDSFGAGVRGAYGIIEFAIEERLDGTPIVPTVSEPMLDQTAGSEPMPSGANVEPAQDIPSDTAGLTAGPSEHDNTESDHQSMPAKVFVFTAAQEPETGRWLVSWPVHGAKVTHLQDMVKMMATLFGAENAEKIELTTADNKVVCYFTVEE